MAPLTAWTAAFAVVMATVAVVVATPAGQTSTPPCPQDFLAKYKNASVACEQDEPEALVRSLDNHTPKTIVSLFRRRRQAGAHAVAPILNANTTSSSSSTTPSNKAENSASSEEEQDPEIMLCTFAKLKEMVPQLAVVEKICADERSHLQDGGKVGLPAVGTGTTSSTTTDKSNDLDEDLHMASCLEEKLELMCPELSSVV